MDELTPELLYWITRLDRLYTLFQYTTAFSIVGGACSIVFGTVSSVEGVSEFVSRARVYMRVFAVALIISVLGLIATPNTKELAAIYILPKIANSEIVSKEIPEALNNTLKLANQYLEDKLQE